MNRDGIVIKGIRQGLLITLGEGGWNDQLSSLEGRLDASPSFFSGGRVALDVGARSLRRADIEKARALLAHHQVDLWALVSADPATEAAAQEMGLVIKLGPPAPRATAVASPESEQPAAESPEGLIARRTLRSGQRLRHPGHIVVIGDVNPGAEIVAGGDIVVWGRVRGMVHAGAMGDEEAVICGLDLAPTQLRIAGYIARSPEEKQRKPAPEMASVHEGRIVAVPWRGS